MSAEQVALRLGIEGNALDDGIGELWALGDGLQNLVSVIVPTYNRAGLITETLDSVFAQSYRPIELIVIDDGSLDETVAVVRAWVQGHEGDECFLTRIFKQDNAGAPVARNLGTLKSSGEFIQYLDSDDTLHPEKVGLQVAALQAGPHLDFAYGPVAKLEQPSHVVYCQSEMSQRRMILKHLVVPTLQTMSPLMRRVMVTRVGAWNKVLPPADDWEFYSRAVVIGFNGVYVPNAFSYYRAHGGERLTSHSRITQFVRGRFGQIESMLAHAPPALAADREFQVTAAWQLLISAAQFVTKGWDGDDEARYQLAMTIGKRGLVVSVARGTLMVRRIFGRRWAARLLLSLPWVYYRWTGLRGRWRGRSNMIEDRFCL
ncbi:MAG: glycosyltransferase family 2 protein [Thiocapsa sp.]|uniref:glycosyltransferase family 2 protein n=1 Tax=Thiocapsa sp. TaxID=2024551 RepID=UPI001BCBE972|nr:glycosyltransferase family A protein [Thiocapsa sp.]QVL50096.1 MAG: glycosyltransferase family 2 protein [Thiocapsa sp.]